LKDGKKWKRTVLVSGKRRKKKENLLTLEKEEDLGKNH